MRNTQELLPTPHPQARPLQSRTRLLQAPVPSQPNSRFGLKKKKKQTPNIYISSRKPPPLSPPPPGEGEAGSLRAALFCCLKATQPRPGLQLLGSRRSGSSSARPGPAAAPGDAGLGAGGSSRPRPAPHADTRGAGGKGGGGLCGRPGRGRPLQAASRRAGEGGRKARSGAGSPSTATPLGDRGNPAPRRPEAGKGKGWGG